MESVEGMKELFQFECYNNKKVLVTGHTGFKGSWLCKVLLQCGAEVTGYALKAPTDPSLFQLLKLEQDMHSIEGDIRDLPHLNRVFDEVAPEIVIHLAAQPIVRASYQNPVYTYETNAMGTVHICECVRLHPGVGSFLNVTTDKVYQNREWVWGYREGDPLDGYDPYSNSKSCSEIITHCYRNSFLDGGNTAVSTARAGNVIGGGDFAADRILPDCIRAACQKKDIVVRNAGSIRPYQHVLEPVAAYLMIAARQLGQKETAGSYNVGPDDKDCITTGELTSLFCHYWGEGQKWINQSDQGPHEAGFLKLDCSKIKHVFGWKPVWDVNMAVKKTVEWAKVFQDGQDVRSCVERQIKEYETNFLRKRNEGNRQGN